MSGVSSQTPRALRAPRPEQGAPAIVVEISDTQTHLTIDRALVERVVLATLEAEGVIAASISVAIVDDATIRALNRVHLDHDCATDVISFGLSDPGDPELSGEIVVSAETAAASAALLGVSPRDELVLYVAHGLLHLCGFDDLTPTGRSRMRQEEQHVLSKIALDGVLSEREAQPEVKRSIGERESQQCTL
jgi:probable rRNA maturation factor